MRPQKVKDNELLEGLMQVLRSKGYDGASLNELAQTSGLKKASLYHRFPGGKKEIVQAVLTYVDTWLEANIAKVATDTTRPPQDRLGNLIHNINILYDNGKEHCIMRAISMQSGIEFFGKQLEHSMSKWISAFTQLAIDFGKEEQEAMDIGIKVLITIQGSLVVARTMGNEQLFQDALVSIMEFYQS